MFVKRSDQNLSFLDDCVGYDCHHGNCFINGDGNVECQCKDGWAPPDCDTPQSILNFYVKYYEAMRNRWIQIAYKTNPFKVKTT